MGDEDGMVSIIHTQHMYMYMHVCMCVCEYHVRYNTLGYSEMTK